MSVSAYRQGIGILPELYHDAETMLSYRYVLGKEALIFDDYKVEEKETENADIFMGQLDHHIRKGMKEKIPEDFEKISHLVKAQEKENLRYAGSMFMDRYTVVLSLETREEISETLQHMIGKVLSSGDKQTQKTMLLVDTIITIIRKEFKNPNLCLTQISGMVNMSSQYVGRVFKSTTGSSVAEYINECRLNKSIEIMLETGCTVKEVLEQVGIENEAH